MAIVTGFVLTIIVLIIRFYKSVNGNKSPQKPATTTSNFYIRLGNYRHLHQQETISLNQSTAMRHMNNYKCLHQQESIPVN